MSEFSFRIRLTTAPQSRLNAAEAQLKLELNSVGASVHVKTFGERRAIADSHELVVLGGPFASRQQAQADGERVVEALGLAFAKLRLGVDAAGFTPRGTFTQAGLEWQTAGRSEQFLNDDQCLMVFNSSVPTKFVHGNAAQLRIGIAPTRLGNLVNAVLDRGIRLSDKEALSVRLVESFIEQIGYESELSVAEKASLLGSLRYLRENSISRTGRDLAGTRLGKRTYAGIPAPKFFAHCYELRSSIVHRGRHDSASKPIPLPVGELDQFVADLLTHQLLDLDA